MGCFEISKIVKFLEKNKCKTIFSTLGIRVESYEPDNVIVAIDVDERHLQHAGFVHGGVFVTLAESAASIAATCTVGLFDHSIVGMEINANHLRSVTGGVVRAKAKLVYHGKLIMVYSIEVTNNNDKLVCISRCTIAIKKLNK